MVQFETNAIGAIGDQNWNQCYFLAGEITQVKEATPWVRCASGNVSSLHLNIVLPVL